MLLHCKAILRAFDPGLGSGSRAQGAGQRSRPRFQCSGFLGSGVGVYRAQDLFAKGFRAQGLGFRGQGLRLGV